MLEKKRWILGLSAYSYSSMGHLVVVAEQHTHIYRAVAERGLALSVWGRKSSSPKEMAEMEPPTGTKLALSMGIKN